MSKHHRHAKKQKQINISRYAGSITIITVIAAIVQLLLTIFIRVGAKSDPTEVYLRNFSSIAALFILADFFYKFRMLHSTNLSINKMKYIKSISVTSIILAVACLVKVAISAKYALQYVQIGNLIGIYYIGEVAVWTAVALFCIAYLRRRNRKAPVKSVHRNDGKAENQQAAD